MSGDTFEMVTRVLTALSVLALGLAALRLSYLAPMGKVSPYRVAGVAMVAATVAYVAFTFGGSHLWLDVTRLTSMVAQAFLALGVWRTGTAARNLLEAVPEIGAELEGLRDELEGERDEGS